MIRACVQHARRCRDSVADGAQNPPAGGTSPRPGERAPIRWPPRRHAGNVPGVSELAIRTRPLNGSPPPQAAAGLHALGTALPATVVGNGPIAERLGVTEDWIQRRTGIRERRVAGPGETFTGLATAAGRDALRRAELDPLELDLVVVATMSQDDLLPNAAPLVAEALGATSAGSLDVGAACSGFLAALALAAGQVEAGRARYVLVIGADLMSRFVNPDDRRTAALFGDGAGAVVVGPTDGPGRIGPVLLRSDGAARDLIHVRRATGLIHMEGHETFRLAVSSLTDVTREAVEAAGAGLGTSTSSSTTRPTAASCARSPSGSTSHRSASWTASRASPTRPRPLSRWPWRAPPRTAGWRPATGCCSRPWGPASPGGRPRSTGERHEHRGTAPHS